MLAPLLTLALLPLALAACPCPPAPAAAEVCGSDHKTYPSACDLDCTAPPGVAAAHPGPCRPADAALGRPTNATLLLSGRRARRSATTDAMKKFEKCESDRQLDSRRLESLFQCGEVSCSECTGEEAGDCMLMCKRNCLCGCLGLHTTGLDSRRCSRCREERNCVGQYVACMDRCSTQECRDRCWLDEEWCTCRCAQQADGLVSSSSSAPVLLTEVLLALLCACAPPKPWT
ncbi:Serine protease inhibitor dipetalogastin [Frankliniella fusca]|uniref:Serine protease inhibitor dipetalogastin n=1 Tax=Frankliniella fusca TaxID=407009 RepID=A0AAE1GR90_9NEOP|nr:Serine protease inhibitor dipetalogastin [Frankliniella fusca]